MAPLVRSALPGPEYVVGVRVLVPCDERPEIEPPDRDGVVKPRETE